MQIFKMLFILYTIGSVSSQAQEKAQSLKLDLEIKAVEFVNLLSNEKFAEAVKYFDRTMKKALSADKLEDAWNSLTRQLGDFRTQKALKSEEVKEYIVYYVTCEFEKASIDIKVVFNKKGEIAGLFFLPAQGVKYTIPDYVNKEKFVEYEISFGVEEWKLPGTLTLPKGKGPFPLVVLIHGSGPNDRDETIGPNKPFRDIAWGLASRGIAVLRYDKRSRIYSEKMRKIENRITVKEEVIQDVIEAVKVVKARKEIDSSKIFLLGHSLGAMLLPRIARLSPDIAGLILMAAAARPLEDLVFEQTRYIYSLDGDISKEEKRKLEELKKQVDMVKSPDLSPSTPRESLPLGIPASYWLDLRGYDPVSVARTLDKPILILHGGRDYQVTIEDFSRWKEALGTSEKVTLKLYPHLNHLFMKGEGKSVPAEYLRKGHVEEEVIRDISDWIYRVCKQEK